MRLFLTILAIVTITGCSEPVDYVFGFSAEETNKVFIVTALFDDKLNVPSGVVGCCLASGGATAVMNPKQYPKTGYFEWYDRHTETYFRATLYYPENLKQIADDLDDFIVYSDGDTSPKRVFLLTSVTSDNQVISWISNGMMGGDHVTRQLIELDRAKGEAFIPDFVIERQKQKEREALKHSGIEMDANQ